MGTFSDNLRRARENKGLKQHELATLIGVDNKRISTWELGTASPSLNLVSNICWALDVEPNDLVPIKNGDEEKDVTTKKQAEFNELINAKNGVYLRLAKGAKDKNLDLNESDMDFILEFMQRGQKR